MTDNTQPEALEQAALSTAAAQPPVAEQEPVASVYTMEALVPGAHPKCHVDLLKPLPAGTKLYTHPAPQPAPVAQGDALTDTYVQQVPDKCDRIVWRGRYYHLPIDAAEHSYTEPSPMAKVAAALRQKAEQEDAAYQARRSDQGLMESEWGPMEDAPPHEDPPMHVAVVEGDDTVRTLQWNRDVAAFAYPAGTLLYAAPPTAQAEGWRPIETAPKDGALIVLGARNGVWLGKYVPVYQSGYRPENPWSSMLLNHDHMAERYTRPTHWRPLPPPPTSAEGVEHG